MQGLPCLSLIWALWFANLSTLTPLMSPVGVRQLKFAPLDAALVEFDIAWRLSPSDAGEGEAWAGAILWHQRVVERSLARFARVAGKVAGRTPFQTAELEAVAFCGIGEVDRAEQHLLNAMPLRIPSDRYQASGLYRLLANPELPGVARLRDILGNET
jgi:hypothetical protein